jgi:hypothetical protein
VSKGAPLRRDINQTDRSSVRNLGHLAGWGETATGRPGSGTAGQGTSAKPPLCAPELPPGFGVGSGRNRPQAVIVRLNNKAPPMDLNDRRRKAVPASRSQASASWHGPRGKN